MLPNRCGNKLIPKHLGVVPIPEPTSKIFADYMQTSVTRDVSEQNKIAFPLAFVRAQDLKTNLT
jgi:hypothetical protein